MKKEYLGYFVIGVASLIGGIFMFVLIVIPSRRIESGVPRDVQVFFTEVFSQQNLFKNEKGRYAASQIELGVESESCKKFNCILRTEKDGQDYSFDLSKEGSTWRIQSKSPMPKEVAL